MKFGFSVENTLDVIFGIQFERRKIDKKANLHKN